MMVRDCDTAEKVPVSLHIDMRDLSILVNAVHMFNDEVERMEGDVPVCPGCINRSGELEDILLSKLQRVEREIK
jgi:hypothetical protein